MALFDVFSKDLPTVTPVAPLKKVRKLRTVGDPSITAAAQILFDPNTAQKPKAPPSKMLEQGSGPAMDQTGAWGGAQEK